MRKDGTWVTVSTRYCNCFTMSRHLPLMNTLDALAQQPERVVGKAEQPLDARAESIHHRVASRFAEDQNLGDVRMSQMQAANVGHILAG